jgi:hypothetical protein
MMGPYRFFAEQQCQRLGELMSKRHGGLRRRGITWALKNRRNLKL